MLTVFGRATSSNVQAVMWLVGELDLPYKRIDLGHSYGGLNKPEFLAMNPHGRIPVIHDHEPDAVIWETGAIMRYLGAIYGAGSGIWPRAAKTRASYDMWAEWAKIHFTPAFTWPIFGALIRTKPVDQSPTAIAANIAAFETLLDTLEAQIGDKPFIVSKSLSCADILCGSVLYRWFDLDIDRKARPIIEGYYQRLAERPAYQKHIMISYDTLKADGI